MTRVSPIDRLKTSTLGCFLRTSPSLVKILLNPAISLSKKRATVDFFLNGAGAHRMIASLPRSGYHYLNLMNDVALDLEAGGTGEYHFDFGWFHSAGGHHGVALDWRWKLGAGAFNPSPPVILNTHLPYYLNSCLKIGDMKTVVMIRNIWDVLDSITYHYDLSPELYGPFLRREHHPNANPYAKIDFLMFIEFFNTWAVTLQRDNVMVMHYENLIADPVAEMCRFRDFMALDISDANLARAAKLCHKDNMQKVMGQPEERVVRVRFEKQKIEFTDDQIAFVRKTLAASRYQDFGGSPEPLKSAAS